MSKETEKLVREIMRPAGYPVKTLAEQAAELNDADLTRHASVSTSNEHYCTECFCCACVDELERRSYRKAGTMVD